jgi:hypothetical protein
VELAQIVKRLRADATVFQGLTREVPEAQARWRPSSESWSILEVMGHLADEEVEDFRTRVDLTLHRPGEAWPPIDPPAWAVERRYNQGDLGETVKRFLAERERSVSWLQGLVDPDWDRVYEHPALGAVSAGDVMTSWLAHDQIHIRQLNRLHRAYLVAELSGYAPDYAGPW